MSWRNHHDVEAGIPSPGCYPKRFLARRARWIFGVAIAAGVVLYISDYRYAPLRPPRLSGEWKSDGEVGELEDIWEDEGGVETAEPKGWGWGLGLPFGKPAPPPSAEEDDEDAVVPVDDYIAPMHPDLSLLPAPSKLFAEVHLPDFLKPPEDDFFPNERLREIISDPPPEVGTTPVEGWVIPDDAFSKNWVGPEMWDQPKGDVRRVQWEGFARGRDGWETAEQKMVREERREAVRRGFVWAWQAYKTYAWGHDEVKPVSKIPSNPFNNWGASIIDSLDTLLIMGFEDEYNLCRPHINQVNFHWLGGRDWSQGYVSEPQPTDDDEDPKEVWTVVRDTSTSLPVFETTIRYLGGMLGAYDLSGDTLLLERSVELAGILGKAFNTMSGLPAGRIDPGIEGEVFRLGTVSIAEVGSMSLEFIRLSHITRDRKWFDFAQRAMDYLEERVIPRAAHSPLIPLWFQPDATLELPLNGQVALGGLADSYYEYLIKTYKLLGASDVAQQWREVYEDSVAKVKELLYVDIAFIPDHDILAIGKHENNRLIPEIEHLTCFAGAMLGLGARLLDRHADLVDAQRITQSCYWLSAATPTGLQPEVVEFFNPKAITYQNVTLDGRPYHPLLGQDPIDDTLVHKDRNGVLRWNHDGEAVSSAAEGELGDAVAYVRRLGGIPPGSKKVVRRGINRPETIESIYYMYRLTGDRKWQEKGWKIFVSWVTTSKVDGGISSILDVTREDFVYGDNMESFVFAETLKYHFLLQSEPDVMSLDDYVLNTEAHPFLTNHEMSSGSQNLWRNRPTDQHLGVRGQGTDAQKWTRLEVLRLARGETRAPTGRGQGGGQGMGGGGGSPNYKPKPPGSGFS